MKNVTQKKRVISLIYHDVVKREDHQQSGFPTADAAIYKLDPDLFKQHLAAIAGAVSSRPILVTELESNNEGNEGSEHPWMITFDDGGSSSHHPIADLLEAAGWRGHFFITTDYVGKPGFMTREQIRDLRRRGHIIGSHSCSHPLRFASRPWEEMKREWSESAKALSEILEERVLMASLPGGQYSRRVAQAAAAAGIKVLFTSEPVVRIDNVDGCLVIGRYSIQRWMPPAVAAGLASGLPTPRFKQWAWWEIKKATKAVGGETYLKLREILSIGLNRKSIKGKA
ncbi:MAG: polysaccharide deacetylase family protein [Acidobacteria bacterium]|nr:polysaccharide deacetylase family protein [Acidobacteriota bacterium]